MDSRGGVLVPSRWKPTLFYLIGAFHSSGQFTAPSPTGLIKMGIAPNTEEHHILWVVYLIAVSKGTSTNRV